MSSIIGLTIGTITTGTIMSSSNCGTVVGHGFLIDPNENSTKRRGSEMQTLYNVYLVYGEDRLNPIVESRTVVACSSEEAKMKSKIQALIKDNWDIDFVTVAACSICNVAIKERPTEVKSV